MPTAQLNLDPTLELHDDLAAMLPREAVALQRALDVANRELAERRLTFGRVKPLAAALTALVLSPRDIERIRTTAEQLHAAIEKVLAYTTASRERLLRFYPAHARVYPYLSKTGGCDTWQVVSRYDVAVTPKGQLKVLELNTGCPGGFMIAEAMSDVTRHGFAELDALADATKRWPANGTIRPQVLADELLALEAAANIEPDAIGVLNDENDLIFELDLVVDALRSHGRQVVLADAQTLSLDNGRLLCGNQVLSLTYNKFRISTPDSPNHCWRAGFERRYADYLAAQRDRRIVTVNNIGGMLLAEDKSLLAALQEPEVRAALSSSERDLLDEHVLWTASWEDRQISFHGQPIDLMPFVREHRDRFVIKPANEGRGFGVVVGPVATEDEWQAACALDPRLPKVVQEYTPTVSFPVISLSANRTDCRDDDRTAAGLCIRPMLLTLGLAIIRGKYHGLVSRVSANAVTNVAREGFGQAVFVTSAG